MLSFENIWLKYGTKTALHGLTLALQKGELMTLLGPSGCGKTSTLQIAGGFLRPDQGRVLLGERDITSEPPERRPTATVFQSHALFPHMSVGENVAYGLKLRGIPRTEREERAKTELERTGLGGYEKARVQELSGGQQQRVALARALVLEPEVLLLDEPLSSLDAKLRLQMRSEIRNLQKNLGITALYVTHDQEEALSISDRVALMNNGSILQAGTPEEIYFSPINEFAASFTGNAFPMEIDGRRIMLRPDQLSPAENGPFSGRLLERAFLGATVNWTLLWKGQKLRMTMKSTEEPETEPGAEVRFAIEKECGSFAVKDA